MAHESQYAQLAAAAAELRTNIQKAQLTPEEARKLEKLLGGARRAASPHGQARVVAEIEFRNLQKSVAEAEALVDRIARFEAQQQADELERQHRATVSKARAKNPTASSFYLDPDADLFARPKPRRPTQ